MKNMYVWYVGYGSNLLRERFLCYILGGKFEFGGNVGTGCTDKTLPKEDCPLIIQHDLFFAKSSSSWGNGGIAFISPKKDESKHTYGRMWKVSMDQFSEIWDQEGRRLYDTRIELGHDTNGIPIWTITRKNELKFSKPSDNYIKTIIAGLKETSQLSNEIILKYLMKTPGIKDNFEEKDLLALC